MNVVEGGRASSALEAAGRSVSRTVVGVKLLIGLAALVVLFVVACDVEFTSNLTTEGPAAGSPPGIAAGPVVVGDFVELPKAPVGRDGAGVAEAAAVADVVGVAEAAANSEAAKGARAVLVLLAEASNGASAGGEKLIRLRMPALIAEFKSELPGGPRAGRARRGAHSNRSRLPSERHRHDRPPTGSLHVARERRSQWASGEQGGRPLLVRAGGAEPLVHVGDQPLLSARDPGGEGRNRSSDAFLLNMRRPPALCLLAVLALLMAGCAPFSDDELRGLVDGTQPAQSSMLEVRVGVGMGIRLTRSRVLLRLLVLRNRRRRAGPARSRRLAGAARFHSLLHRRPAPRRTCWGEGRDRSRRRGLGARRSPKRSSLPRRVSCAIRRDTIRGRRDSVLPSRAVETTSVPEMRFELEDVDYEPLSLFPLLWRWTSASHAELARDVLDSIRPIGQPKAAVINQFVIDRVHARFYGMGLNAEFARDLQRLHTRGADDGIVRDLASLAANFSR